MAIITGNDQPNRIAGTPEDDVISGLGGNDALDGLEGNDTLLGDDGDDKLNGGVGDDTLEGGNGNDFLFGGSGTNTLNGGSGDDIFFYTNGFDTIIGGEGIDTVSFARMTTGVVQDDAGFLVNDELHGFFGPGVENIIGSNFNDNLEGFGWDSVAHAGRGNDFLWSDQPFSHLYGDAGDDSLSGGQNGQVFMDGGVGNDALYANGFASDLKGGKGRDTFHIFYQYEDVAPGNSSGSIIRDFKHGQDFILLTGRDSGAFYTNDGDIWTVHSPDDSSYKEATGDHDAEYTMSFQIAGISELDSGDYLFLSGADLNRILLLGSNRSDRLIGSDGDDLLVGRNGNDFLQGLVGDDTLLGGEGKDRLLGGDGEDDLDGGTGNDTLNGGNGINSLDGGPGNDTFQFTEGAAFIWAGDGFDILSFANASNAVFYEQGAFELENTTWLGFVESRVPSDPEFEEFSPPEKIIGSRFDDVFLNAPGPGADFVISEIRGDGGNDSIAGNGSLYGGSGNDALLPSFGSEAFGGPGEDIFTILLNYGATDLSPSEDAIIKDFRHGKDQIVFDFGTFDSDPDALLTNEGDLWTVHFDFEGQPSELTFEVSNVTELQAGDDYIFL